MNEPKPDLNKPHHQATLLPWYLAKALDGQERLEVETHLGVCEACQTELDEMRRTKAALKTVVNEREGPSPAVLTQVIARIREEKVSTQPSAIREPNEAPSLWGQIQAWLQSLFARPWVPILATLLIVGQSALLLTNLGKSPPVIQPRMGAGPVIERDIPPGPTHRKVTRLQVSFLETATQGQIQSLLQDIQAQIVNGPSPNGLYMLEISTQDPASVTRSLQTLRARSEIILLAQPASH